MQPPSAACRRCRADLSLVLAVLIPREQSLVAGRLAIQADDYAQAEAHLDSARKLGDDGEVRRLLAVVAVARGDFPAALAHHRAAMTLG